MKIKYLYLSIVCLGFAACNSTETIEKNDESKPGEIVGIDSLTINNIEIEEVIEPIEDIPEVVIDYSKFEHYATITTKQDLVTIFGEENLKDGETWYAEGTVKMEHTELTNPDNGHVVKFLWLEGTDTVSSIEASYYMWNEDFISRGTQAIETENGLKLGMSLAELRAWNEASIRFSGFGWDYSGEVSPEAGTKLSESATHVRLMNNLDINLLDFDFMLGDVELNSDDEELKDAPVLVSEFTIQVYESNGM